ncbi:MAG: hypothetical protein MMC23_009188 [Stictis urceolatum]|nr:hypothetical protein [Stictis urceolata]
MAGQRAQEPKLAAFQDESDLGVDGLADFTTNIIDYMERRRPQIRLDESVPTTPTRRSSRISHSSHSSIGSWKEKEPEFEPRLPSPEKLDFKKKDHIQDDGPADMAQMKLCLDQLVDKLKEEQSQHRHQSNTEVEHLATELKQTRKDLASMGTDSQQTAASITQMAAELQQTRKELTQMVTDYQQARTDLQEVAQSYQETQKLLIQMATEYKETLAQLTNISTEHQQTRADLAQLATEHQQTRSSHKEATSAGQQANADLAKATMELEQTRARLSKVAKERTFYKKESFKLMDERNQAQRQLASTTADRDLHVHLYNQETRPNGHLKENFRRPQKSVAFEGSDEDYTCLMVEVPAKGRS